MSFCVFVQLDKLVEAELAGAAQEVKSEEPSFGWMEVATVIAVLAAWHFQRKIHNMEVDDDDDDDDGDDDDDDAEEEDAEEDDEENEEDEDEKKGAEGEKGEQQKMKMKKMKKKKKKVDRDVLHVN